MLVSYFRISDSDHLLNVLVIFKANRIAVLEKGTVCEIGTHDELMSKASGRYKYLQSLQDMDMAKVQKVEKKKDGTTGSASGLLTSGRKEEDEFEVDKKDAARNARRARLLSSGDMYYIVVGGIGACKYHKF